MGELQNDPVSSLEDQISSLPLETALKLASFLSTMVEFPSPVPQSIVYLGLQFSSLDEWIEFVGLMERMKIIINEYERLSLTDSGRKLAFKIVELINR